MCCTRHIQGATRLFVGACVFVCGKRVSTIATISICGKWHRNKFAMSKSSAVNYRKYEYDFGVLQSYKRNIAQGNTFAAMTIVRPDQITVH